jgi:hypothetical protein
VISGVDEKGKKYKEIMKGQMGSHFITVVKVEPSK